MQLLNFLGTSQKEYSEIWQLQKELVEKRAKNEIEDSLILVEHSPVYTTGSAERGIAVSTLNHVPIIEIERGGKKTFHGPGQLVAYPIFHLHSHDLRNFLRELERILIESINELTKLQVQSHPKSLVLDPGQLQTGIWIENRKLASIGIAVRKWVTYHGLALNLSTDLKYFEAIHPCGFESSIMTSIEKELPTASAPDLMQRFGQSLAEKFSKLHL